MLLVWVLLTARIKKATKKNVLDIRYVVDRNYDLVNWWNCQIMNFLIRLNEGFTNTERFATQNLMCNCLK